MSLMQLYMHEMWLILMTKPLNVLPLCEITSTFIAQRETYTSRASNGNCSVPPPIRWISVSTIYHRFHNNSNDISNWTDHNTSQTYSIPYLPIPDLIYLRLGFLPAARKTQVQPVDIGWPTGYVKKLSNCQACCLAQLCLAAA